MGSTDLRTRTSLFCGVLALAIAISVLLKGKPRLPQLFFTGLAGDIGLWYLAQWLYHAGRSDLWARWTAVLAVLLPQFAVHLFESIVPEPDRPSPLKRVAGILMIPMLVLVLTERQHGVVRGLVILYVFGLIAVALFALAMRGERSGSRAVQRRVRFLVSIGALAAIFSLADFLWFIGAPLPPVSAVLSIVFLFVLSESLTRSRLVDLYDILGQLLVSTALAFALAGIFYVFVVLLGGFQTMYLGAILAAIVILVVFEPLRTKAENYTHKFFFRERVDLERAIGRARAELVHVLQVSELQHVVISAIETSRRATGAALYLPDPLGSDFALASSFGPAAPPRIDVATARPLIERLSKSSSIVLEEVGFKFLESRRTGWTREAEADERLLAAAEVLGPFKQAVCLGVHGERQDLVAILLLVDDRVRDAFSPDEVSLLESLAVQVGVVIENSRQYRRMQERDRLAALGQMAAGLAHEVKNPLGAIKGAAQLLGDPCHETKLAHADMEFVGIILEEVERLDRVVGSVLDYARPHKSDLGAVDVNGVVRRTLTVLASDRTEECELRTELDEALPAVRADAEQLRQVLINLVRNAVQAMGGRGTVEVITRRRSERATSVLGADAVAAPSDWVEIAVRDRGPGIAPQVQKNLFVPFFTTKDRGTGLGLAISQRVVEEMGGRIEVVSRPGAGSTFSLVLPVVTEAYAAPRPGPGHARDETPTSGRLRVQPTLSLPPGPGRA
ncbi:MAG TPA: ATP-binding protein [Polyangiaceae bacterium]|nr:ATP-binding protein [Polyangiaceae bacterium]